MSYATNQLFVFIFLLLLLLLFSFEILLGSATSTNPSTPFGSNHDCSGALFGFSDCLEFVDGGANVAGPNRGCCSGLGHVLSRSVTCLCEAILEGARLGVPINVTKALALPSLCGLSFSPIPPCYKTPPNQSPTGPPNQSPTGPSPAQSPSMQPTPSPSSPPYSPSPAPSFPPTTSPSLPPFSPEVPSTPPPTPAPATSVNSKSGAIELGFSVLALVVAFVVASFSYSEF